MKTPEAFLEHGRITSNDYAALQELASRLHRLLGDPHPGLATYDIAVTALLKDMITCWFGLKVIEAVDRTFQQVIEKAEAKSCDPK